MRDKTYADIERLHNHYAAIGNFDVYIYHSDSDYKDMPWDRVISVESGGFHRLSIPVGLTFRASIPNSSVQVRWTTDLEVKDANGSGVYKFDTEKLNWIFGRLPGFVQRQLVEHFRTVVLPACKKHTDEIYEAYLTNKKSQYTIENLIRDLEKQ